MKSEEEKLSNDKYPMPKNQGGELVNKFINGNSATKTVKEKKK